MKLLIYDCEIIRCIPQKGIAFVSLEPHEPFKPFGDGFEYCQGWRDFKNLGISVIGCQISNSDRFNEGLHSFTNPDNSIPGDFPTFNQLLEEKPYVIGFNTKEFDDKLCRANVIKIKTHYDLLEEIRIAAYGSPKWKDQPKKFNYSLEAIARANGMSKTGSGSLAPQLWQQGKRQKVINYCLNDVKLTHNLLMLGLKGQLIDPNTKKPLKLRPLT